MNSRSKEKKGVAVKRGGFIFGHPDRPGREERGESKDVDSFGENGAEKRNLERDLTKGTAPKTGLARHARRIDSETHKKGEKKQKKIDRSSQKQLG